MSLRPFPVKTFITMHFSIPIGNTRVCASPVPCILLAGFLLLSNAFAAPLSSPTALPSGLTSGGDNATIDDNHTEKLKGKNDSPATQQRCRPLTDKELTERLLRESKHLDLCQQPGMQGVCTSGSTITGRTGVFSATNFETQEQVSTVGGCASCVEGRIWHYQEDRFPRLILKTVCKLGDGACQDGWVCKQIFRYVHVLRRRTGKRCTNNGKERWEKKTSEPELVVVGCECEEKRSPPKASRSGRLP